MQYITKFDIEKWLPIRVDYIKKVFVTQISENGQKPIIYQLNIQLSLLGNIANIVTLGRFRKEVVLKAQCELRGWGIRDIVYEVI